MWHRYFCRDVRGVPIKGYLVSRILPRPRDLVFIVKAAISVAVNRGHAIVTEADILEGEKQYSQYALESILVENGITIHELENVLYEFIGCDPYQTETEVKRALSKAGIPEEKVDKVIVHLCVLSFLGIEVSPNEFRFAEEPQTFRRSLKLAERRFEGVSVSPRFKIHPAFWGFLECREDS
jgi:hypothetical protein